jgi:hypothetical protein
MGGISYADDNKPFMCTRIRQISLAKFGRRAMLAGLGRNFCRLLALK